MEARPGAAGGRVWRGRGDGRRIASDGGTRVNPVRGAAAAGGAVDVARFFPAATAWKSPVLWRRVLYVGGMAHVSPSVAPTRIGSSRRWHRVLLAAFTLGGAAVGVLCAAPTHLVEEAPVRITTVAPGVVLVDFGRVAFGNLRVTPPPAPAVAPAPRLVVHFGEALAGGRILRQPPGTVRYARAEVGAESLAAAVTASAPLVVAPAADRRNTQQQPERPGDNTPPAVLTPAEWGVILPFRWIEIEGWPGGGEPTAAQLRRRAAFARTWQDDAAGFRCSDPVLNELWELCRYSIKATTFAGVYVDGDRERIPYEADAYLNQLSHYACDPDPQMARDTFDHLLRHPTWPTEWAPHMIFMAHADWMQTGDRAWLAARYEALRPKLQRERARADGLLTSTPAHVRKGDIVDWPVGERDGFVFTPVNTVVNAFHLRALELRAELARAVGRDDEAAQLAAQRATTLAAFQARLFDAARGWYRDGEGTDHASLHANLFPLAFGLVPPAQRERVAAWLARRGMACSVYASQYLLDGLWAEGASEAALALLTAPGDRSWRHMLASGTTITWEAWDQGYKPNQDWNHAWGAAPANLLPRHVLGVQPLAPGWARARVRPQPGALAQVAGRVPTPRGAIEAEWTRGTKAGTSRLGLTLPAGVTARVELPAPEAKTALWLDGKKATAAERGGDRWIVDVTGAGRHVVEVR